MKYCTNCGGELNPNAVICLSCGAAISNTSVSDISESGTFGWSLLGFFLPVAGLALFIIWKDTKPKASKAAGTGALVSTIAAIALFVAIVLLYITFMAIVLLFMSELMMMY